MCRAEEGRPAEVCRKIQVSVADLSLDMQMLQDVLRMLSLNPPKEGVALASWSGKGVLL